ncbi:hypothetical protein CEUSTIGMA_g2972.t1 [Chlamydomonas eustigma]|uniref:Tyrosine specific protein phosphatases domain-containing protein n=1 Tax=Chlamydomonas eustigma TaxID=1157962 RepID=A0A250WXW2_9CHLO|nr:hypothetical protein CEUSTIGMA_g2972.t1 [Chlamydomonas eustigma]|eukprot:GAX75529.1 hypothetical protein CEUSTIGMA_g2972.t1 [Chlamydomonas eustigma]
MLRPEAPYASLPKLPAPPAKEMAGPTPWCNWAIPGRVMAGAYPASLDDAETERILTCLLELGMNTFVCLQAEVNINTPEHAWRAQHGLRPYIKDAQKILSKAHETGNPRITQQKIDFLHLPIIDGNVTTDSAMSRLADDCCERVLKGERLYVHCWGGHGRTGTLISTMLGRLYNLPYTTAMRYCQAFHDSRVYPQGVRSPQTPVQRAQVRRLLAAQSAVTSSTPAPARPVSASLGAAAAPVRTSASNIQVARPGAGSSILAAQPVARQNSIPEQANRGGSGVIPASPLRGRPGVSVTPNRYGPPSRSVGESPMRSSSSDFRSSNYKPAAGSLDRLASGFSKLQSPSSAGGAQVMAKNGVAMPYSMAQRPVKRSEVNAR